MVMDTLGIDGDATAGDNAKTFEKDDERNWSVHVRKDRCMISGVELDQ